MHRRRPAGGAFRTRHTSETSRPALIPPRMRFCARVESTISYALCRSFCLALLTVLRHARSCSPPDVPCRHMSRPCARCRLASVRNLINDRSHDRPTLRRDGDKSSAASRALHRARSRFRSIHPASNTARMSAHADVLRHETAAADRSPEECAAASTSAPPTARAHDQSCRELAGALVVRAFPRDAPRALRSDLRGRPFGGSRAPATRALKRTERRIFPHCTLQIRSDNALRAISPGRCGWI